MTQPSSGDEQYRSCCELLSNLYLCIGWHSLTLPKTNASGVVNCFQICIFVSDDTARRGLGTPNGRLWIAFKFVSLYRMTQPSIICLNPCVSCELLSNLYLCIGWHSCLFVSKQLIIVVNCFQICIFVSDDTARLLYRTTCLQLWIAFKFVSLYRMTQPNVATKPRQSGCELLSNLYLCIGWHSCMSFQISLISVVNCFQICIFVSDDTAPCTKSKSKSLLWIAFKFVSLYRMTQPAALLGGAVYGCELLSNLYLCIGWHSQRAR